MRLRSALIMMISVPLSSGFQQVDSPPSLEERLEKELDIQYYDEAPPLRERLLKLGDPQAVSSALLEIAERYKAARTPGRELRYLVDAIFALGKFRERRAMPLLFEIAEIADDPLGLKIFAVQSIGEIDPDGAKSVLLELLKNPGPIRYTAAEALSKTDDPAMMRELEVAAAHEVSHAAFLLVQGLADAMRARINAKSR
jgi:hypothetical protein